MLSSYMRWREENYATHRVSSSAVDRRYASVHSSLIAVSIISSISHRPLHVLGNSNVCGAYMGIYWIGLLGEVIHQFHLASTNCIHLFGLRNVGERGERY